MDKAGLGLGWEGLGLIIKVGLLGQGQLNMGWIGLVGQMGWGY